MVTIPIGYAIHMHIYVCRMYGNLLVLIIIIINVSSSFSLFGN